MQLFFTVSQLCIVVIVLRVAESTGQVFSPSTIPPQIGFEGRAPSFKAFEDLLPRNEAPYKVTQPRHFRSPSSIAFQHSRTTFRSPVTSIAFPPSISSSEAPSKKWMHGSRKTYQEHHNRMQSNKQSSEPIDSTHPRAHGKHGHSFFPSQPPFSSPTIRISPASAPSPAITSQHSKDRVSPAVSPMKSSFKKAPLRAPTLTLPPPPPGKDCTWAACTEPFTYTLSGSSCGCVLPIQVKLCLSVAIYKFFPLVSELAEEISASILLNQRQVRIMGADAANQQLEETTVLVNLIPEGEIFDYPTAISIYKKFWQKDVSIKPSFFGAYEVLYVHYPGLPPSPPAPQSISTVDSDPYPGHDNGGTLMKPLGVEVPRRRKEGLHKSTVLIVVLSSIAAFALFIVVTWLVLLRSRSFSHQSEQIPDDVSSSSKRSGFGRSYRYGSMRCSESISSSSGILTYTGSAKAFTLDEIRRATDNFDSSKILGEGGFGLVYSGVMCDGRNVAVKILKKDDQHGGREFLAEVEMLSRLHHRNLIKLIGICIANHTRCLVYDLVPNGSLESHLHGADKETGPLDWDARMRISLGAARGLAYLHEDCNPRVIHRDFKSSNILLEDDYTPKVSDFGLARTALDEGNKHISTHVMGTFGYLAPEYAMTGHLLVKSDVYSYGVVLLELLTGRKPVDLLQPPGQENLVTWARPLLTSKESLETIIDPVIKSGVSSDTVAKVAAIASMCVQPEVSHRPFMSEVVQALQLVCSEFEEALNV